MFLIQLVDLKSETPSILDPTIITTTAPFISEDYFDTKIQAMFASYDQLFEKQDAELK